MSGFTFGSNTGNQAAPAFGSGFGAPAATVAPTLGGSTTTFGQPAAAAAPTFGAPAASAAPTFGAPVASAAPTFGTAGSTLSFGAPATSAAPTFGAPTSTAPTFGAPAVSTAPTFGAPTASVAPTFGTGTTFGTSTAAPTFGAAAPTASAAPAFGTTTLGTTTSGFGGFGATPAASTAATATSTAAAAPSFGLGGGAATTSFNFGAKPAAQSSAGPGATLNFGTTTTAATSLGGGLFGKPTTTTTTATPFVGLGGVDIGSSHPKPGESKPDNIRVKETQVPDEIVKTVENLKNHIKMQKASASDISRVSTSKLTNVFNEISQLQWALQEISNNVQANYNQIKLLRKETNRTIQSVEMAQRTQDTPPGLQYENNQPFEYFQSVVARYEQDLCTFREQIALTERHMRSLANPQSVTPADLKRGFQQINESFISLAGRLHEIHQKVEQQKEQYLNLRKYRLRDTTNVFAPFEASESGQEYNPNMTNGPTAFSAIAAMNALLHTGGVNQSTNTTLPLNK